MTETEIKLWAAILTAIASLIIAIVSHLSTRSNQRAIEKLRDEYAESRAESDAKRDYQYEARKRLYKECGPVLFQLAEFCEAAFYRITGLAQTAQLGNLEPGRNSFLRDEYYRVSTLYRLLAPSAVLKILQRQLTLVDLSLDKTIQRQYTLVRQAFFAFGDEFSFARLSDQPLQYKPFDDKAEYNSKKEPAIYWRQGLPLGVMEGAIEAILAPSQASNPRVMTYSECEADTIRRARECAKPSMEFPSLSRIFIHVRVRFFGACSWHKPVSIACCLNPTLWIDPAGGSQNSVFPILSFRNLIGGQEPMREQTERSYRNHSLSPRSTSRRNLLTGWGALLRHLEAPPKY